MNNYIELIHVKLLFTIRSNSFYCANVVNFVGDVGMLVKSENIYTLFECYLIGIIMKQLLSEGHKKQLVVIIHAH